jgi:hypothetical protein
LLVGARLPDFAHTTRAVIVAKALLVSRFRHAAAVQRFAVAARGAGKGLRPQESL